MRRKRIGYHSDHVHHPVCLHPCRLSELAAMASSRVQVRGLASPAPWLHGGTTTNDGRVELKPPTRFAWPITTRTGAVSQRTMFSRRSREASSEPADGPCTSRRWCHLTQPDCLATLMRRRRQASLPTRDPRQNPPKGAVARDESSPERALAPRLRVATLIRGCPYQPYR